MLSTLVCNYALLGLVITQIIIFFSMRIYPPIIIILHAFQASNEEGASRVFELLQGKAFRSVGWTTLFDCLSIYDEKFRQSLQTAGALLPEFQEGDAKALVAYLNVLQKVMVSHTLWVLNFYGLSFHTFLRLFSSWSFKTTTLVFVEFCFHSTCQTNLNIISMVIQLVRCKWLSSKRLNQEDK